MPKTQTAVPFTITRDQRQQLHDLRYSREQIDKLTPAEAHAILDVTSTTPPVPAQAFALSFFDNVKDTTPKPESRTLAQIVDQVTHPLIRPTKDGKLWTGGSFSQPKRAKANVETVSIIMLDIDDGLTFDEAEQLCRALGCVFLMHTTFNYEADGTDKFRIILPLLQPVSAADYPALWQALNRYFQGKLDRNARDASRMFYVPVIKRANAHYRIATVTDAELLDVAAWLSGASVASAPQSVAPPAQTAPDDVVVSAGAPDVRERYARKVFDEELGRVRSAGQGARNQALNNAVFACAQFIPHGLLTEAEIHLAFTQAAQGVGLADTEIAGTLRSAIAAGQDQPRDLSGVGVKHVTAPSGDSVLTVSVNWTAEGYAESPAGMKYRRARKSENTSGDDIISLCNFNARITAEVIEDDGVEPRSCYEIEATLSGAPMARKAIIPASEYSSLKWLDDVVGVRGMIFPGKGEHVRCAIKSLSKDAAIRHTIAHVGWRDEGGTSSYYHNGGAINADGLIQAEVKLPADFAAYDLPAPPQGQARNAALVAALGLLDLAPDDLAVPFLSAPAAAILGGTDYSHHLTGPSGAHKSCWTALLLAHFGTEFRFDRLPAHWAQDTAIALLTKTHLAKDALLVIDDFKPLPSRIETQKLIQKAEFVLRAQANRAGRGRAMTDGGLRTTKAPRGLVVSTGEDVPPGESLRARLIITEVGKGDIRSDKLTVAQKQARVGLFAQATSAFIQWLATDNLIGKLKARRNDDLESWRDHWLKESSAAHKRHASNLAHITYAWRTWLDFVSESGAQKKAETEALWEERILPALGKCGAAQAKWLVSENPADRFIELIRAALSSGVAHLTHTDGKRPDSDIALSCGWRDDDTPRSKRIGFVDADGIYLIPDSAYEVAASFGEGITVTQTVLWKRLFEAGKILRDETRGTFRIRKFPSGVAHDLVHLKRNELL